MDSNKFYCLQLCCYFIKLLLRALALRSFLSSITLLSVPAEMYVYGTQYAVVVLSQPLFAATSANVFLPVFYDLKVTTSYEVLS